MPKTKRVLIICLACLLVITTAAVYLLKANNSSRAGEHFVDERVELIALIFRLAGRPEYSRTHNRYQRSLNRNFRRFSDHPAVEYARDLPLGFDAVTNFAIHMKRDGDKFALIENRSFLFSCERWTTESTEIFIDLVNDFYIDTEFAAFFQSNIPYYVRRTNRFVRDLYRRLDKDWFYAHGVRPDQIRVILSSSIWGGYGPSIHDADGNIEASYSILQVSRSYRNQKWFLVHEIAHSFANPIAEAWYAEDEAFRRLSDNSVDLNRMPWYATGLTMAREYVTRAFTILYRVEVEGARPARLFREERRNGFPDIQQVYEMVVAYVNR